MDIKHSRRLLVIGAPDSGALGVITDLTGSVPQPHENESTAGLTHEWNVETAYYRAKVPIWVDEISDLRQWREEFLKPEAKEVVEVVGAWVYCFKTSLGDGPSREVQETMKAIHQICEHHAGDYGADSVMLAVAMPSSQASSHSGDGQGGTEEWEDACLEHGFEYIDYSARRPNSFGEKTGFERLKEALEANEWAASVSADSGDELDLENLDLDDVDDPFTRRDEAEMTAELFGMKAALAGVPDAEDLEIGTEEFEVEEREEKQVEDLDRLMGKLLAVKEQSADLPEAQRKRMAAKAVREVMWG